MILARHPAHTTEGHIVRLADDGRPPLVEFHAARQPLDRHDALFATLPDGRRLELIAVRPTMALGYSPLAVAQQDGHGDGVRRR